MTEFKLFVRQAVDAGESGKEEIVEGYVDESDSLTADDSQAVHFNVDTLAAILPTLEYDGCRLVLALAQPITD